MPVRDKVTATLRTPLAKLHRHSPCANTLPEKPDFNIINYLITTTGGV